MAEGTVANVIATWQFNRRWRTWIPAIVCVVLLFAFLRSPRLSQPSWSSIVDVGNPAALTHPASAAWWKLLDTNEQTHKEESITSDSDHGDSQHLQYQQEDQLDRPDLPDDETYTQLEHAELVEDEIHVQHEHELNGTDATTEPTELVLTNPYDEAYLTRQRSNNSYSRTLVVARTREESMDWITDGLPESDGWEYAFYLVDGDNENSEFHIPANRGNEAMVYLSYIIDHYDALPEISIFLHAHQFALHNDNLLGYSSLTMLKRLSSEKVVRDGYLNLRCEHDSTCSPGVVRPYVYLDDPGLAQRYVIDAFDYFAPDTQLPEYLAAPCCGQFAVSRDTIRRQSKDQFLQMREWLMTTNMSSYLAGRVFEYTWHYILTGEPVVCPSVQMTYCDAYSICFEDETKLQTYFEVVEAINNIRVRLDEFSANDENPGGRTAMLHVIDNQLQPLVEQMKKDAFTAGGDHNQKREILYNAWERTQRERFNQTLM